MGSNRRVSSACGRRSLITWPLASGSSILGAAQTWVSQGQELTTAPSCRCFGGGFLLVSPQFLQSSVAEKYAVLLGILIGSRISSTSRLHLILIRCTVKSNISKHAD